jgi:C4-dicarboxylate transporter, DctM subunit
MTGLQMGMFLFGFMLVLMALRVPIAMAMFIPGAVGYIMMSGWDPLLNYMKGAAYARFSVYDLSVIPLFLLMGAFATQGGLSKALFGFANGLLGRFRGGMAMAAIVACAAFGAVCGSSVATAATIGQVALPQMKQINYSGRLSTATLAVGGTLGILVPPSVPLVIYAILTEQNIAKLFAAAFVPAILAIVGYIIAIGVYVRLYPGHGPASTPPSREEFRKSFLGVLPVAGIFLTVFGGIYGGLFTPTEGAAIGAASTFLVAVAKREMSLEKFKASFYTTAATTGMIFMIFFGADMLNGALALSQMPAKLADWISHLGIPPLAVIAGILCMYVILGCVMDELSMIMLTLPVLFPVVMGLDLFGLNPTEKAIWFGILVLMTIEIGLVAPPVGLNVYVINGLAKEVPMGETYRGVVPFLMTDAVRITILLFFPSITLWLVRYLN